ncbi:MAG: hypothetical protein PHI63_06655 [Patescibacteria group bacterium]|jgi:hypothetical protein|nr:hypothetical protein [Patescibacteria group bacterium]
MTTSELSALRDRILSQVPLCPAAFVTAYIRQAAAQFFKESEVWRYFFEDIDIVEGKATYELSFPTAMISGVEILRIDYATHSGVPVGKDLYDLDYLAKGEGFSYYLVYKEGYLPTESVTISNYAAWSALTTYAVDDVCKYDRSYWVSLLAANLNKNPVTETAYWEVTVPTKGLDVCAVLNPSIVSGYVTPRLWLQWADAIMWGAILAMCSTRTRPWYDPILAATARDEYGTRLALARQERVQQFAYDGNLRMTNPEGWL